ncbi:MAG TPA: hypothetical protein VFV54_09165 [Thermoanaerobaculia bacterium]|nr:hypothetical protein [Thermoanaerobaculia bacterium]
MIAARVAAALELDPTLSVRRASGGLGEVRVSVDGVDAVDSNRFLYPRPSTILAKVRAHLATLRP